MARKAAGHNNIAIGQTTYDFITVETYNNLLDYIRYIGTHLDNEYDYEMFSELTPEERESIIRKNKIDKFFKDENNNI